MDRIKILVCCHKECQIPRNQIFLPIQVGKKLSCIDLKIQSDSDVNGVECDNISALNGIYCEMTAMYWAWKNVNTIFPSLDYIGLCHYRRYFRSKKNYNSLDILISRIKSSVKTLFGLKQPMELFDQPELINDVNSEPINRDVEKLKAIILDSDIVCTQPIIYVNNSVKQCFEVIGREYISILEEIIKNNYEDYYHTLQCVLQGKSLVSANMIIIKMEYLDEYCSFIFGALNEHLNYLLNNKYIYDINEKVFSRVLGYLAEILTATYVLRKKEQGFKVKSVGKYFLE
ncbi:MAG: DUF4422 domain-containing protein [Faecalibacterium prausnitzii]|nr:DUF4422 domain-containing protein [Faecalibacterium prausnitzii]